MSLVIRSILLLSFVSIIVGCGGGEEEPFRKNTAVVKGSITVDGVPPDSPLMITCVPVGGMDKENPTYTQAMSDDNGNFELSTYEQGDGIPEGEYTLTFVWGKMNLISRNYGGPDKLGGKYADPKTSGIKLSVKGSEPIDMGTIELTTDGEGKEKTEE